MDAISGEGAVSGAGEFPGADGLRQGEVDMDTARGARADDEVSAEAETFHRIQDGPVALMLRMEGAIDVNINEQIVSELAEALADDVAASVGRLNRAQGKGYLLLA